MFPRISKKLLIIFAINSCAPVTQSVVECKQLTHQENQQVARAINNLPDNSPLITITDDWIRVCTALK